jgi:hypothetical protein
MHIIQELLENACPSIRYRIRSEILGESINTPEMTQLQTEILDDGWVQKFMSWQQPDGWIGRDFHGENSMETGIRVLREKGMEKSHPVITKALQALSSEDDKRMLRGIGKVGKILDDRNLGGAQMIRATVFAYAGIEDLPFIQEQIKLALSAFEAVTSVKSVHEITEIYKGKLVFLPETIWPSIYHLRLLALTHGWRSEENQLEISNAIKRLVQLSPIPYILVLHKSQLIAPASFCMLDFNSEINKLDDAGWMMWFHRMELLARLGVTHLVPELQDQIARLKILLTENQGTFALKVNHYYFRKWSSYSGLMLEKDWRDLQRRKNDLTFRSLLILHY